MKKKTPQQFISFAQNYEDVILWRALKHVKKGFYIDVGAAWPEEHSVTKAFYDRGWHGINIEPNPIHFLSLKKQRKRDINLQIAVGECEGELQMNFIGNTGLSTLDKDVAAQHKIDGWGIETSTVNVKPLSRIISLNIPAGQDIHFLKVDIEGFEKQALQSHDWMSCRPWVVLVELILPTSHKDSFADWEPILLDANYQFVYADGLNRFYVAKEHASLIDAFKFPPNIFDSFIQVEVVQAKAKAEQAQQQTIEAKAKAEQAQQQTVEAKAKAEQAQQQTVEAKAKAEQAQQQTIQAQQQTIEAKAKAEQAQQQTVEAKAKAEQAQQQTVEAKAKAEQAQQQTVEAKAKAEQAQQQTIEAKAKAEQAQQQTIEAKAKAEQAQQQTVEAKAKAEQAQQQTIEAKAKAEQAQQQTIEAKAKAEQAQQQTIEAKAKAEQAQQQTVEAKAKAEQAQAALDAHVAQLHAVYNSSSWRITAPLRWPVHQLHLLRTHGFKQRAKAALKKVLPKFVFWLISRPKLKSLAKQIVVDLPITWQRGDIFFGLDLQHQVQLSQAITYERMRNDGVIVQFLIYDLLPIQLKELFANENLYHFHEKLMQLIGQQHRAICISKTTADTYKYWLQEKNIAHNPMLVIDWVHMGADQEVLYSSRGLPENSSITLKVLKTRPTFLSVSTLEPRKGHAQVLDAVEILWANHQDINLVFVGQQGWKVEKLEERIANHPENGKRLFWLKGISDEYLELVYQASTCLVAASINEGFGLPLIEAAHHKLPIICRDIPVFREVAGQHAFYFDASDAIGLSASIKQWLLLYEKNDHPTSDRMPWKTWSESAENLKHLLIGSTLDKSAVQRQLFLDISELVHGDSATGVQRVVKNYLINLVKNPPKGFRVLPVYATTSDCYRYANAYMVKKLGIDSIVLNKPFMSERPKPFVRSLLTTDQQTIHQDSSQQIPEDLKVLTPRARQIYQDLKQAMKSREKGGV